MQERDRAGRITRNVDVDGEHPVDPAEDFRLVQMLPLHASVPAATTTRGSGIAS